MADTDPKLVELEILKAVHQANFNRWEKRRNYEWLLSYAIWAAIAGFVAIVVFGKDSAFHAPSTAMTFTVLGLIAATHTFYLFFIIKGTLRDLKVQRSIEYIMMTMRDNTFGAAPAAFKKMIDKDNPDAPVSGSAWHWIADHHGLFGQVLLTVILCAVAFWAVGARQAAPPPVTPGYVCQGCSFGESPAIQSVPSAKKKGKKIGIGGNLAAPPLPHHRTCGSASGGSAD